MAKRPYQRFAGIGSAVLLLTLAACGDSTDPVPNSTPSSKPVADTYVVPDRIRDATVVWSAEPGIDMFSAESTLIRANMESSILARLLGQGYPYLGFNASIQAGTTYVDFGPTGNFRRVLNGRLVGTAQARIQEVRPTDNGFESVVCVASLGLDEFRDGKYYPSGLALSRGSAVRAQYNRIPNTGNSPTTSVVPSESGTPPQDQNLLHWQAPRGNLFTGWKIVTYAETDPDLNEQRCAPWALSVYPDAPADMPTYANDTPPPVQPAYPGWPDAPL